MLISYDNLTMKNRRMNNLDEFQSKDALKNDLERKCANR